jgi:hypothetical protein
MAGLDVLQSAQHVTVNGKRFVLFEHDDWEALIEWLESVEDTQVVRQALDELKAAGNDRARAGWLRWDDIKDELA